MTFQDIADKQWAEFLAELSQEHSLTESQIEEKRNNLIIPINFASSPNTGFTDEQYEDVQQIEDLERYMQRTDSMNTRF